MIWLPVVLFTVFGFLMFVIMIIVVLPRFKKNAAIEMAKFDEVAGRLGLFHEPGDTVLGGFQASGDIVGESAGSGASVRIHRFTQSSGESSTTYWQVHLTCENPRSLKLGIHRQGRGASFFKKLGLQDVETGDPEFDDTFVLKSNNEPFASQGLLPEVRDAILRVYRRHDLKGRIQLKKDALTYTEVHNVRNVDAMAEVSGDILAMLDGLWKLATIYNQSDLFS